MAGEIEGDLLVAEEAVARMIERALAALAAEDAMGIPEARKIRALAMQAVDQPAQRKVVAMGARGGAELRGDTAGALLPPADESARVGLKEDEAQQIAFAGRAEPA